MQWELFFGGFFGALVGGALGISLLLMLDWLDKRTKTTVQNTLDTISEKEIEGYVVEHFSILFPDLEIYDDGSQSDKLAGVQFPVKRGFIDILCIDKNNNLVILELKKGKAQKKTASQVQNYIIQIERGLAQRGQSVRGIIIAPDFDPQLKDLLAREGIVSIWTFKWHLKLNRRPTSIAS